MKLREMHCAVAALLGEDAGDLSSAENRRRLLESGFDLEHAYQELEMDSPYVDTHSDVSYGAEAVALHSHTFYELLCIRSGRLQYLLGAERYRIGPGDIVIVPPGIGHRPQLERGMAEPFVRDVLWISPLFLEKFFGGQPGFVTPQNAPRLLRTAGTPYEFLCGLFHGGVEEAKKRGPLWQQAVIGNTLVLTAQIVRALDRPETCAGPPEQPELLDDVLGYIETHMAEKISLEGTARQFLVSQSTISQIFRARMGVSFYRCVTQRRLIAAKSRILMGDALDGVGSAVGFADYSTFYRAFKREYGISPLQFRKLQGEGKKG